MYPSFGYPARVITSAPCGDSGRTLMLSLLVFGLLGHILAPGAFAQSSEPLPSRARVGVELDLLPYLMRGAYGSAWGAKSHWRARAVITRTSLPGALVDEGFEDHTLQAYTALIDYFPDARLRGWWVGAGFEYWRNRVSRDDGSATARWNDPIATLGGGYVKPVWRRLYLNPWAAAHATLRDRAPVDVGGPPYRVRRITGEASLKLGWIF